ncbi:MAG: NADH-quinone oxidoreductase subunit NuoK [Candidatus Latescibacterota bacterium]|jgi:NADH-quinone oxidoreductase subunit K
MTATVPLEHGMILAAVLFGLGLVGLLVRRNIIHMLMSIEVMLNAAGLAFVVAGARWVPSGPGGTGPDGQIMFMIIITMAAAEVAVGLALILRFYHHFRTLDADAATTMKG